MNTGLETVARSGFAVLKKLVLRHNQSFVVAEGLVGVEGDVERGQSQRILAHHEVLVVVDEDRVLHQVAEVEVDLVVICARVPREGESVPTPKLHGGEVGAPERGLHQGGGLLGRVPEVGVLDSLLQVKGLLLDTLHQASVERVVTLMS